MREGRTNRSLTKKIFSDIIIQGMHDKDYLVGIAIQNVGFTIRRRRSLDLAMLREKRKKYEQLDLERRKRRNLYLRSTGLASIGARDTTITRGRILLSGWDTRTNIRYL